MALNYSPNITVKDNLEKGEFDCKYLLAKDSHGNAVLLDIDSILCTNILTDLTGTLSWDIESEKNKLITLQYINGVFDTNEVRWKFRGVQGPIGLQGIQGYPGADFEGEGVGVQGPQGIIGIQGILGVQGSIGTWNASLQGYRGLQGNRGRRSLVKGLQGVQGSIGTFELKDSTIEGYLSDNSISITKSGSNLNYNFGIVTTSKVYSSGFYEN